MSIVITDILLGVNMLLVLMTCMFVTPGLLWKFTVVSNIEMMKDSNSIERVALDH